MRPVITALTVAALLLTAGVFRKCQSETIKRSGHRSKRDSNLLRNNGITDDVQKTIYNLRMISKAYPAGSPAGGADSQRLDVSSLESQIITTRPATQTLDFNIVNGLNEATTQPGWSGVSYRESSTRPPWMKEPRPRGMGLETGKLVRPLFLEQQPAPKPEHGVNIQMSEAYTSTQPPKRKGKSIVTDNEAFIIGGMVIPKWMAEEARLIPRKVDLISDIPALSIDSKHGGSTEDIKEHVAQVDSEASKVEIDETKSNINKQNLRKEQQIKLGKARKETKWSKARAIKNPRDIVTRVSTRKNGKQGAGVNKKGTNEIEAISNSDNQRLTKQQKRKMNTERKNRANQSGNVRKRILNGQNLNKRKTDEKSETLLMKQQRNKRQQAKTAQQEKKKGFVRPSGTSSMQVSRTFKKHSDLRFDTETINTKEYRPSDTQRRVRYAAARNRGNELPRGRRHSMRAMAKSGRGGPVGKMVPDEFSDDYYDLDDDEDESPTEKNYVDSGTGGDEYDEDVEYGGEEGSHTGDTSITSFPMYAGMNSIALDGEEEDENGGRIVQEVKIIPPKGGRRLSGSGGRPYQRRRQVTGGRQGGAPRVSARSGGTARFRPRGQGNGLVRRRPAAYEAPTAKSYADYGTDEGEDDDDYDEDYDGEEEQSHLGETRITSYPMYAGMNSIAVDGEEEDEDGSRIVQEVKIIPSKGGRQQFRPGRPNQRRRPVTGGRLGGARRAFARSGGRSRSRRQFMRRRPPGMRKFNQQVNNRRRGRLTKKQPSLNRGAVRGTLPRTNNRQLFGNSQTLSRSTNGLNQASADLAAQQLLANALFAAESEPTLAEMGLSGFAQPGATPLGAVLSGFEQGLSDPYGSSLGFPSQPAQGFGSAASPQSSLEQLLRQDPGFANIGAGDFGFGDIFGGLGTAGLAQTDPVAGYGTGSLDNRGQTAGLGGVNHEWSPGGLQGLYSFR